MANKPSNKKTTVRTAARKAAAKKPPAPISPSAYPIVKDLPMPSLRFGGAGEYPFDGMVVNDAFIVPKEKKDHARQRVSEQNKILKDKKSPNRFVTRTLKDGTLGVFLKNMKEIEWNGN